jgi:hypothetical protein
MQKRRLILLAVFYFLASGVVQADPLTDPYSIYLLGEVKTTAADGKWKSSIVSLIKRTALPLESRIEILSLELQKNKPVAEKITLMNVTGNTYVVTDKAGSYSGIGAWFGEPWRWTRWTYSVHFAEGRGGLEGEDHLDERTLKMRKRYYDGEGTTTNFVSADFSLITESAYELLAEKLRSR